MISVEFPATLRVAIKPLHLGHHQPTAPRIAQQGSEIIKAIGEAARAECRLVVFSEGSLISPHKRVVSRSAPELDEADWSKVDWSALREQLQKIASAAKEHDIWVVVGAVHELSPGRRPHNCLYVLSDRGEVVTRYDKRRLSTTEITYLYTPGTEPIAFEVDGMRIGLVLGLEMLFPDLLTAYADDGVDLIVAASNGGGIFQQLATSYAAITQVPIALVIPPAPDDPSRAGVFGPWGVLAISPDPAAGEAVIADIPQRTNPATFYYKARHGFYDERLAPDEPRTRARTTL